MSTIDNAIDAVMASIGDQYRSGDEENTRICPTCGGRFLAPRGGGLCNECLDKLRAQDERMKRRLARQKRSKRYIVVSAKQYGLDPAGGDWVAICKLHKTLCNFTTRALARQFRPTGEWCEACMAEEEEPAHA